jgi:hypothetical protein
MSISKTFTRTMPPQNALQGLEVGISAAATAFATKLQQDLEPGIRRGGDWTGDPFLNPNVSSAPGEPEQFQSGDLQGSISVRKGQEDVFGTLFAWEFGFFGVDMEKLTELELDQENPRYRGWLKVVAEEQPETQESAFRALVEAMGSER